MKCIDRGHPNTQRCSQSTTDDPVLHFSSIAKACELIRQGGIENTYLAGVDEDSGLARADKIRVRPLKRHVPRIAAEEAHHAWGYAILDGTKER